jgi:HK97 family phage major capsid protein
MNKQIRALLAKKSDLVGKAKAINELAGAESREFTDAEQAQFDALSAQIKSVNASIERATLIAQEELSLGAVAVADDAHISIADNREADPRRGFTSMGDYARAVMHASMPGNAPDQRLLIGAAAPSTYGGEGVGSDGGFAVPPQFAQDIYTHSLGEDSLLPMTDNTTVTGNSMVFPKDETTPWGTDGVRAYWQAEATAATATKPKLSTTTLRLYKLMALVPLTDELLADTNALNSYLPSKVGDSIRWKTNEAILFGDGVGKPLGAFAATNNAVVTVSKESGQATLTLQALNIAKMVARLPAGSFPRSVWLCNNDVLPALWTLTLGNYPIYLPPSSGIQGAPYGMLSGRPIIVSQHCKTFTNAGDIVLVDPQYIRSIQKAAGVETATSMHLYFDADATAFRTTFRVDAQPKIVNPIAPFNGSNNLSPFVQLQTR